MLRIERKRKRGRLLQQAVFKANLLRRRICGQGKALTNLADSEEKYRTLLENAHDGIIMMADERPIFANATLMEILGYEPWEFEALTLNDFLPDTPLGRDLFGDIHRRRIKVDCALSASLINVGGRMSSLPSFPI